MKIINYMEANRWRIIGVFVALVFTLPVMTEAAPACVLLVSTSAGIHAVRDESDVLQVIGDPLKIFWISSDTKRAENKSGAAIPLFGHTTKNPRSLTSYNYTFINESEEAKCSLTVHPVTGNFYEESLQTEKKQPILIGEATKVREVKLEIYKQNSKELVHESDGIKVIADEWRYELDELLPNGSYDVVLKANEDWQLNKIASDVLTVGDVSQNQSGTIVVQTIPLLTGGLAKAGATVNLVYLHMLNVSNDSVTITGISMEQAGTASTDVVKSLMATDDTNKAKGEVGGTGSSPFRSGEAKIPITLTLKPKETRLFTLKAALNQDISDAIGDSLRLEVSGVSSRSNIRGDFPLRGVTWVLSK